MKLGRRSFLAVSGALVAGAAGCVTGDDNGDTDSGDDGSTDGGPVGNNGNGDDGGGNGDTNGTVDDRNGEEVRTPDPEWRYGTGGSIAAVSNGVLYGREGFANGSGGVVALGAATGERLWGYGETSGYSSFTTPVVDGDVYVGYGDDAIGSGSGYVAAIADDGTERWRAEIGSVYEPPGLDGDRLYVGSDDGAVYCFDASTGEAIWQHDFESRPEGPSNPSVAAVADGLVYVSLQGGFLAIDANDGTERWLARPGGGRIRSVHAGERVYAATRSLVAAFEDGELQWTSDRTGGSILAVRDGAVYVSDGFQFAVLDAATGQERWGLGTDDRHAVGVGDAGPYVGVREVQALDSAGETRWQRSLDGSPIEFLTPADDGVYAGTDGGVYRLDGNGGVVAESPVGSLRDLLVADRVYAATDEQLLALDL
jgi:outer membrane protein assembly factor BamB